MLKNFYEDDLGGYNPWEPWQQQTRKIIREPGQGKHFWGQPGGWGCLGWWFGEIQVTSFPNSLITGISHYQGITKFNSGWKVHTSV